MSRKSYTILILGRHQTRFRKLQLSARQLTLIGVGLALVVVTALLVPNLALRVQSSRSAVDDLRTENRRLREERTQFEDSLARIAERLDRFEIQAGRLATEMGVEGVDPAAGGGLGDETGEPTMAQELESLTGRASSLSESLSELDQRFRERMRFLASTPNTMPVPGWFSHGFGWRKDPWTGEREFHRGIDIVADLGTPIVATADGVISKTARKIDYGKVIDLSHGYGYVTRYAHLSEVLVRPGQRVERGDVIGRVGSTGRSTGPHLHYEVFRDGRRVNPWKYLGQKGS